MDNVVGAKSVLRRVTDADIFEPIRESFVEQLCRPDEIRSTDVLAKTGLRNASLVWGDTWLSVNTAREDLQLKRIHDL